MIKLHEVADDYCIPYKLYIHYNGVIIFATGKPEENKQSTPHRKCHSHLWGPNIALSH